MGVPWSHDIFLIFLEAVIIVLSLFLVLLSGILLFLSVELIVRLMAKYNRNLHWWVVTYQTIKLHVFKRISMSVSRGAAFIRLHEYQWTTGERESGHSVEVWRGG